MSESADFDAETVGWLVLSPEARNWKFKLSFDLPFFP